MILALRSALPRLMPPLILAYDLGTEVGVSKPESNNSVFFRPSGKRAARRDQPPNGYTDNETSEVEDTYKNMCA